MVVACDEFWPNENPSKRDAVVEVEDSVSTVVDDSGVGVVDTESIAKSESLVVVVVDEIKLMFATGVLVENEPDSSSNAAGTAVVVVVVDNVLRVAFATDTLLIWLIGAGVVVVVVVVVVVEAVVVVEVGWLLWAVAVICCCAGVAENP